MYSPRASARPRLRAAATPALACLMYRTRGSAPNSAAIRCSVSSVEPSSTTSTSTRGYVCASTLLVATSTRVARLYVG